MRKRLIAIDMDGTLFSGDHTISETNKKAIKAAQEAGHVVMICSGRMPKNLADLLEKEGIGALPMSGGNGAVTLNEGQTLREQFMSRQTSEDLYSWLEKNEYPFMVCTSRGYYASEALFVRSKKEHESNPDAKMPAESSIATEAAYRKRLNYKTIENFQEIPAADGILKFYLMTPNPDKKEQAREFAHALAPLTVTSSFASNLEISDAQAHKGTGLRTIAAHFDIPMADTVAIGDNFNDVGMFEAAGLAIAMGNAEAAIKDICDVVTRTNFEDGVAYAIEQFVLNQEA